MKLFFIDFPLVFIPFPRGIFMTVFAARSI